MKEKEDNKNARQPTLQRWGEEKLKLKTLKVHSEQKCSTTTKKCLICASSIKNVQHPHGEISSVNQMFVCFYDVQLVFEVTLTFSY